MKIFILLYHKTRFRAYKLLLVMNGILVHSWFWGRLTASFNSSESDRL